ncbi:sushi, von Willebrand factor type A, EGF and pentraxin domain-containing protein 1-like isoform X1 [Gopherus evgoodei]|uniref:sushi, von Willebrand factor type A, EGF and pentraxin domain-containing protein 1-like isoform X1 n=1 Tax=Gopherus evgoodei TaxID=1825980 RepID=UPI0011D033C4|nr:sushi, von Willebrand factor type A, EGF and pentraxin domain-containing protein 1-like isoform X1 [Gopherus evgoodei]
MGVGGGQNCGGAPEPGRRERPKPIPPCSALICPSRKLGHILVRHGPHLHGGLQRETQGAEEEPVWEWQLLLAGIQILLSRIFLFSVNCGRPEADFNSMVYGNDWWVGSVVRYGCRPGFLLVGDPARACQSDGHWTPKPTCLRICLQGQIEINERDIDGSCSSTCTDKAHLGAFLNHGCIKISNCVTKRWSWTCWFARCDFCECDCYVPCSSSV